MVQNAVLRSHVVQGEHGEISRKLKNLTKKILLSLTLVGLFEETRAALINRGHRAAIFAIAQLSFFFLFRYR